MPVAAMAQISGRGVYRDPKAPVQDRVRDLLMLTLDLPPEGAALIELMG